MTALPVAKPYTTAAPRSSRISTAGNICALVIYDVCDDARARVKAVQAATAQVDAERRAAVLPSTPRTTNYHSV